MDIDEAIQQVTTAAHELEQELFAAQAKARLQEDRKDMLADWIFKNHPGVGINYTTGTVELPA